MASARPEGAGGDLAPLAPRSSALLRSQRRTPGYGASTLEATGFGLHSMTRNKLESAAPATSTLQAAQSAVVGSPRRAVAATDSRYSPAIQASALPNGLALRFDAAIVQRLHTEHSHATAQAQAQARARAQRAVGYNPGSCLALPPALRLQYKVQQQQQMLRWRQIQMQAQMQMQVQVQLQMHMRAQGAREAQHAGLSIVRPVGVGAPTFLARAPSVQRRAVVRSQSRSSKYRGVSWHKGNRRWTAQIRWSGKQHHLGSWGNEEDAAKAYDAAAVEHHRGMRIKLNFPPPVEKSAIAELRGGAAVMTSDAPKSTGEAPTEGLSTATAPLESLPETRPGALQVIIDNAREASSAGAPALATATSEPSTGMGTPQGTASPSNAVEPCELSRAPSL